MRATESPVSSGQMVKCIGSPSRKDSVLLFTPGFSPAIQAETNSKPFKRFLRKYWAEIGGLKPAENEKFFR